MNHQIDISLTGLGIILYSPFAVSHIAQGDDYLSSHFWKPQSVAQHVTACELTAFCTGSPGDYCVTLFDGPYPEEDVKAAMAAVRLGIKIKDHTMCVRDLYNLMDWHADCPAVQTISIADGIYELTVFTKLPPSGILGDQQEIKIHFRAVAELPNLKWTGVPSISGETTA